MPIRPSNFKEIIASKTIVPVPAPKEKRKRKNKNPAAISQTVVEEVNEEGVVDHITITTFYEEAKEQFSPTLEKLTDKPGHTHFREVVKLNTGKVVVFPLQPISKLETALKATKSSETMRTLLVIKGSFKEPDSPVIP